MRTKGLESEKPAFGCGLQPDECFGILHANCENEDSPRGIHIMETSRLKVSNGRSQLYSA